MIEDTVVLDPPGQPELTTHHMALPRILQRLEKLGYRVRKVLNCSLFQLTDIVIDYDHSMPGFSSCDSTLTVSEQSDPLCQRDASSTISDRYDILTVDTEA